MRKLLVCLLSLFGAGTLAQNQMQMLNTTRDQINMEGLKIPTTGTLWGVASANKGEVVGEIYLDTLWTKGNVKLYQSIQPIGGKAIDTLSGLAMRYNVHFNEIEILLNTFNDVKALQGSQIKVFSLEKAGKPAYFLNTQLYKTDKQPTGFYEILVPGKVTLAALPRTIVKKPTYNAAFEVGTKDTRILLDADYYVLKDGKAEKVKPTKKSILEFMPDKAREMEAFLKTNDLDLKERTNLVRLFEHYNSF
ncbi:hypothetical protein [Salmonirosea aquatica]|uniref:Uncharacterized protein n=1 Tax=Salmonirosea aquatica TaxID=2654236 RepID=A0A7C9FBA3_9BACT|nr:hypothetical protein [Cytophagaceae bacterium SJW1-29]